MATKRIAFVINTDWFFKSHRLELAKSAIKNGYEVHLITNFSELQYEFNKIGIITHQFNISRSGTNPFQEIISIIKLKKLLISISPNVVHLITNKCVLYGGLSLLRKNNINIICAIAGLGYLFNKKDIKTNILKKLVIILYKIIFSKKNYRLILQNSYDKKFFIDKQIIESSRIHFIKGSGVDLEKFTLTAEREDKLVVTMVSRLLKDKGVNEFIKASEMVKKNFPEVTFQLVGSIDSGNPNSIKHDELEIIKKNTNIDYLGFSSEIFNIMRNSNIIVFPSYYGEGLPKVLIEASASGRAIITTDNPGCMEAVIPEETAIIVPVRDVMSLKNAIIRLINDSVLRKKLGQNARVYAENHFDVKKVVNSHMDLYKHH